MIGYFGTSLDEMGHYFFRVETDKIVPSYLFFPMPSGHDILDANLFPFHPDALPMNRGRITPLGEVNYYKLFGFRVVVVSGSCLDERSGSKSIFFTEENMKFAEFVLKIMSTPICKKIISQMPFDVKWNLNEEYSRKLSEITK
jgi:hypothetical protein